MQEFHYLMDLPMKLTLFFLWERHLMADRMAPRAITRFLRSHPGGRGALGQKRPVRMMAFSPGV
jgi:hypothetical protein